MSLRHFASLPARRSAIQAPDWRSAGLGTTNHRERPWRDNRDPLEIRSREFGSSGAVSSSDHAQPSTRVFSRFAWPLRAVRPLRLRAPLAPRLSTRRESRPSPRGTALQRRAQRRPSRPATLGTREAAWSLRSGRLRQGCTSTRGRWSGQSSHGGLRGAVATRRGGPRQHAIRARACLGIRG